MNFRHKYSFEADTAGGIYYDGAVMEISDDNGQNWVDVSKYVPKPIDPGYTQKINSTLPPDAGQSDASPPEANPLAGRMGFAGESPGYPSYLTTQLDYGMTLAGKTVKFRFRIGTDEGTGAPGWDIDDFSFGGPQFSSLTNTPFGAITANAGICSDGGTDGGTTVDAGRPDAVSDVRTDTGTTTDGGRADVTGDVTGDGALSDAPRPDVATPRDAGRDTGTTTTTTTGGGGPAADDGCDCSVPGGRAPRSSAAAMLSLLGALAMVLRRRRRTTH